jgi:hypothetical protein
MKIIKIAFLFFIILCFFAAECFAFRCGSGLVSSGDSKTRVLMTCGQPTSKGHFLHKFSGINYYQQKG